MAIIIDNSLLSYCLITQGPVVGKPININLGLKLNQGFNFFCSKGFQKLILSYT